MPTAANCESEPIRSNSSGANARAAGQLHHLLQCLHPIGIARAHRAPAGLPTGRRDQAREPGKLEACEPLRIATGGMPIRLGLDAVGGPSTATMASMLSPGAHLVIYAWLSGVPIHVPQGDLIAKRLNIHGFWMYYEEYLPKMRAALTEATKVVASGKLSLPITTTYKPSQIKDAIEHSQRGGKVLLDFNHPN
jgi:NADPH:quinone reductase-like Zn-dependent oxidoreductase